MVLIDAEKSCDQSQCSFLIKTFSKTEMEGNFNNLTKAGGQWGYKKPIHNIRYNGNRMFCVKTKRFILTTSIQFCVGGFSQWNMARQRNGMHPD